MSESNLPVNVCLLRHEHGPHDWWYTPEGGGHMLRGGPDESDDPHCKQHHCPGVRMNLHEQARAEAEKRGHPTYGPERGIFTDGFLAGHEAATRTRVVTLPAADDRAERAAAAVLKLHHADDDGDCPECGVDAYGEPRPWPCATARAIDAAMRPGSVDTHTDTPGEDTRAE